MENTHSNRDQTCPHDFITCRTDAHAYRRRAEEEENEEIQESDGCLVSISLRTK